MTLTQAELDAALDRQHLIPVQVSSKAPLPANNHAYDPIRNLQQVGFQITLRELLHAIGSKTAALPSSATDECLKASLLYTYLLDLERPNLCFKPRSDSDLQTPRSQELGIGMMCLLAGRAFNLPWDQLAALPGRGLRFDYCGRSNGFDGIFESKGTSHRRNQGAQIDHGIEKKAAHHQRGERFDVELIISTFVGREDEYPNIVVGDPNFDELAKLYETADNRFFRLRHYSRILQFVGLPKSAFALNRYALAYLKGEKVVGTTIMSEKQIDGFLAIETLGGDKYFGRWFDSVAPKGSRRYSEERYDKKLFALVEGDLRRRVFQGMREDVYHAGFSGEPFSHDLLTQKEVDSIIKRIDMPVSVFSDGTIQIFTQK